MGFYLGSMSRFVRRRTRPRASSVALRWVLVLAVFLVLALPSVVSAANFGSRYINTSCCTLYGGRANIDQATLTPTSVFLALARVEADNAGSYLVQSGLIKAGSPTSWANCPDVSSRSRFFEALTPSGTSCNKYSNQSLTRAAVLWSTSGSTSWSAWLDGSQVFVGNVGFGAASGFLAGNEISTTGTANARFGSGSFPWARATQRGGGSYTTIASSFVFKSPSTGWTVGSLPSPFTITGSF